MVCFMCHAQLEKTHKLMTVSRKAEHILTELFSNSLSVTPAEVAFLNGGLSLCSMKAEIHHAAIHQYPDDSDDIISYIKEEVDEILEPVEVGEVKKIFTEEAQVAEVKSEDSGIYEDTDIFLETYKVPETIKSIETENNKNIPSQLVSKNCKRESLPFAVTNQLGCKLADKLELDKHLKLHSEKKPYSCSICRKSYVNKYVLKRHIKTHSGEHPYICSCGKSFVEKGDLKKHKRTHSGEKKYACKICSKQFHENYQLKSRLNIHEGTEYSCTMCDKTFCERHQFKQHFSRMHANLSYACQYCEMKFKDKNILKSHLKIHTEDYPINKPFSCDICKKSFSDKRRLSIHLTRKVCVKVVKVKRYCCKQCKKICRSKVILNNHIQMHTENKLFACDSCENIFTEQEQLKSHVKIHKRSSCPCDRCGKTFYDASGLNQHMKIHTGEKPYVCDICLKTFVLKKNLKRHLRMHT